MKSTLIPVLVKNKRITPDIILQYCRSAPPVVAFDHLTCWTNVSGLCLNVYPVLECMYVSRSAMLKVVFFPFCSTYNLDHDSVINQYITTLLLLQEDEEGAGDPAVGQEEAQPLSHTDTLDRVLQIIPMLHNTSKLTDNLCAAIFKVFVFKI